MPILGRWLIVAVLILSVRRMDRKTIFSRWRPQVQQLGNDATGSNDFNTLFCRRFSSFFYDFKYLFYSGRFPMGQCQPRQPILT
jgi:hypothetical protein